MTTTKTTTIQHQAPKNFNNKINNYLLKTRHYQPHKAAEMWSQPFNVRLKLRGSYSSVDELDVHPVHTDETPDSAMSCNIKQPPNQALEIRCWWGPKALQRKYDCTITICMGDFSQTFLLSKDLEGNEFTFTGLPVWDGMAPEPTILPFRAPSPADPTRLNEDDDIWIETKTANEGCIAVFWTRGDYDPKNFDLYQTASGPSSLPTKKDLLSGPVPICPQWFVEHDAERVKAKWAFEFRNVAMHGEGEPQQDLVPAVSERASQQQQEQTASGSNDARGLLFQAPGNRNHRRSSPEESETRSAQNRGAAEAAFLEAVATPTAPTNRGQALASPAADVIDLTNDDDESIPDVQDPPDNEPVLPANVYVAENPKQGIVENQNLSDEYDILRQRMIDSARMLELQKQMRESRAAKRPRGIKTEDE